MKKLTYEYIKNYIEKNGYVLLSTEYSNAKSYLTIKCNNGHVYNTLWNNFQQNTNIIKCSMCRDGHKHQISINQTESLNNDELEKYITNFTSKNNSRSFYQSLKKEKTSILADIIKRTSYLKANVRFNERLYHIVHNLYEPIKCKKCLVDGAVFFTFDDGYGYCSLKCNTIGPNIQLSHKLREKNFDMWNNKIKNAIVMTPFDEFIKTGIMSLQCKTCGFEYTRSKSYSNTCPKCSKKGISKQEKDVLSYIKTLYKGIILENKKKIIKNPITNRWLELDIYLPDCNKAIEYNGTYWHSLTDRILYDEMKKKQCEQKNIKLLVVKEEDWKKNKNNCLEEIRNFINK